MAKRKRKRSVKRFKGNELPTRYKEWRKRVLTRDDKRCQMPGCNCNANAKLHVHHIIRWVDDKSLRYNTDNGITLCKKSHDKIFGKEYDFESLFNVIVKLNKSNSTRTSQRT